MEPTPNAECVKDAPAKDQVSPEMRSFIADRKIGQAQEEVAAAIFASAKEELDALIAVCKKRGITLAVGLAYCNGKEIFQNGVLDGQVSLNVFQLTKLKQRALRGY